MPLSFGEAHSIVRRLRRDMRDAGNDADRKMLSDLQDYTVGKMKQFASWFTHGVPGGAGLRKAIYESKSAPEILSRVEAFFEARLCGALSCANSEAELP